MSHLGQAEPCIVGRDRDVAYGGRSTAEARGPALDGSDDGDFRAPNGGVETEDWAGQPLAHFQSRPAAAARAGLPANAEIVPCPRQHDGLQHGIAAGLVQKPRELRDHRGRHQVAFL